MIAIGGHRCRCVLLLPYALGSFEVCRGPYCSLSSGNQVVSLTDYKESRSFMTPYREMARTQQARRRRTNNPCPFIPPLFFFFLKSLSLMREHRKSHARALRIAVMLGVLSLSLSPGWREACSDAHAQRQRTLWLRSVRQTVVGFRDRLNM